MFRTTAMDRLDLSPLPGKAVAIDLKVKAHEANDTKYCVSIHHMDAENGDELLDAKILEPQDEMFITNITYYLQKGLLKDTLVLDINVFNRLGPRNPYSINVMVTGSLAINTVSVQNNETVFADSYWNVPTLRMDVPKGYAIYKIKLSYNNDNKDLETISLG